MNPSAIRSRIALVQDMLANTIKKSTRRFCARDPRHSLAWNGASIDAKAQTFLSMDSPYMPWSIARRAAVRAESNVAIVSS